MSRPAATDHTSATRELPFIDSHSLAVKAPPEQVWDETIGTGGHVFVVRRLLSSIKHQAERS